LAALNLRSLALIRKQAFLRGNHIEIRDQPAGIAIQRNVQRALRVRDGCILGLRRARKHLQSRQRVLDFLKRHQYGLSILRDRVLVTRIREELAWTKGVPLLTRLVRSDDIPSPDRPLPRPLTAEQDQLIQQELLRRDDVHSNALLLLRHTGMRIGECLDLPPDCLRRIDQDQWAIHVPLGKLRTERLVPVDSFVCRIAVTLVESKRVYQVVFRNRRKRTEDTSVLPDPRADPWFRLCTTRIPVHFRAVPLSK